MPSTDALVIVHAEGNLIDPGYSSASAVRQNKMVCSRVAKEAGRFRKLRRKVYYLETEHDGVESDAVHPELEALFPYMSRIPVTYPDTQFDTQFLRTKELMIRDGIERAYLAGFRRGMCVRIVYHLLTGEDNPDITKDNYDNGRRSLRWSARRFERVFAQRIEAYVLPGLTR